MVENRENVPKGHESFRPIVPLERESRQEEVSAPLREPYAISERTSPKCLDQRSRIVYKMYMIVCKMYMAVRYG